MYSLDLSILFHLNNLWSLTNLTLPWYPSNVSSVRLVSYLQYFCSNTLFLLNHNTVFHLKPSIFIFFSSAKCITVVIPTSGWYNWFADFLNQNLLFHDLQKLKCSNLTNLNSFVIIWRMLSHGFKHQCLYDKRECCFLPCQTLNAGMLPWHT